MVSAPRCCGPAVADARVRVCCADPCAEQACDTLANINAEAMELTCKAAAAVLSRLAQQPDLAALLAGRDP